MQNFKARTVAILLWLKERYEKVASHKQGVATLLLVVIFAGTFLYAHPAAAFDTNDIANFIASIAKFFANLISGLIVTIIEYLIPVMLYNNFATAPVVVAGWALVRDTVNMFFVIILIVIAFGTIFGNQRFMWQKQVSALLITAIVVNFSKTLCGIMIDFGQVVMLTFANALREIAAGNIVELFGLNKMSSFSSFNAQAVSSWDLAFASIAAVFILSWVLVIMIFMFAILLYRIVALWVLIVLAPLAWLFRGEIGKLLSSQAYTDWWSQFKCLVAIGPVLTFFLWLTLAVAGAGGSASGFDATTVDNTGNAAGFLTQIFEFQSFMSMVVGSAMLIAGMKASQNMCAVMSGTFLGKTLGRAAAIGPEYATKAFNATKDLALGGAAKAVGGGMRLGGGFIKGTAKYTGKAGAWTVDKMAKSSVGEGLVLNKKTGEMEKKGLLARGTGKVFRGIGKTGVLATDRGRAEFYEKQVKEGGILAKVMGRGNLKTRADKLNAVRQAEIATAGEAYKGMSSAGKIEELKNFAAKGHTLPSGKREAVALLKEMLENPEMMEDFRKAGGDIGQLNKRYGAELKESFKGDEKTQKLYKKFKKKFAHQTDSIDDLKTEEDWRELDKSAFLDERVRAKAQNTSIDLKNKKGEVIGTKTAAEFAEDGKFGSEKRDLWKKRAAALSDEEFRIANPENLVSAATPELARRAMDVSIKDGNLERTDKIFGALVDTYKSTDTTDEQRLHVATNIDNITGGIEKNMATIADLRKQIGSGKLKPAEEAAKKKQLEAMNPKRQEAMQKKLAGFKEKYVAAQTALENDKKPKFGKLPSIGGMNNPESFVRETFEHASPDRKTDASQQMNGQLAGVQEKVKQAWDQEETLLKSTKEGLQDEIAKMRLQAESLQSQRITARKTASEHSATTVSGLEAQSSESQKRIDVLDDEKADAFRKGDLTNLGEINRKQGEHKAEIAKLQKEIEQAKDFENDPEIVRLKAEEEALSQVSAQTREKWRQLKPEDIAAIQALRKDRVAAEEEVTKLKSAVNALEALRRPPT